MIDTDLLSSIQSSPDSTTLEIDQAVLISKKPLQIWFALKFNFGVQSIGSCVLPSNCPWSDLFQATDQLQLVLHRQFMSTEELFIRAVLSMLKFEYRSLLEKRIEVRDLVMEHTSCLTNLAELEQPVSIIK